MAIKKSPTKKEASKQEKVLPAEVSQAEIDKVFDKLPSEPDLPELEIIEVLEPEEPTPPSLTKDELFKLQLTQMQARAAEAEAALEIIRRDMLQKQIDPENKLARMGAFIRGRTNEAATAKAAYEVVVKQIEDRLKISLKEWAYNDENGQLSKVDL